MTVIIAGRTVTLDARAALRLARTELSNLPWSLRAWFAFLLGLLLLGVYGTVLRLLPGAPDVFGTSPIFEWGILIATYVFFATTTSGLCLASSLGTVFGIERFKPLEKRHAVLAVLCLVTAFGVIALDLRYPIRLVFGVVLSPSITSPMWWMGTVYGIYLCCLLVEVWSMFFGRARVHRAACLVSSGMAIIAPSTLGAVFGAMGARPFWHGWFAPVYVLLTAFLSGVALLGVVFYLVNRLRLRGHGLDIERALRGLGWLLVGVIGIVMALTAYQTVVGLESTAPGFSEATTALLSGPLGPQSWIMRVVIGLICPFVILALPWTRTPLGIFVASCLALVGMLADRLGFVAAGQIAPTTGAAGIVSNGYASYSPSLAELSIVVGAIGFLAITYSIAERYLDLGTVHDHSAQPACAVALVAPIRAAMVEPTAAVGAEPAPEGEPMQPEVEAAAEVERRPRSSRRRPRSRR